VTRRHLSHSASEPNGCRQACDPFACLLFLKTPIEPQKMIASDERNQPALFQRRILFVAEWPD